MNLFKVKISFSGCMWHYRGPWQAWALEVRLSDELEVVWCYSRLAGHGLVFDIGMNSW